MYDLARRQVSISPSCLEFRNLFYGGKFIRDLISPKLVPTTKNEKMEVKFFF